MILKNIDFTARTASPSSLTLWQTPQHHGTDGKLTEVNSCDCMKYLTELTDPAEMLEDFLLADQKYLWWEIANDDDIVDESIWYSDD